MYVYIIFSVTCQQINNCKGVKTESDNNNILLYTIHLKNIDIKKV